jgi:hypothetical protein
MVYDISGRKITKYSVIYGVHVFWPTLISSWGEGGREEGKVGDATKLALQ